MSTKRSTCSRFEKNMVNLSQLSTASGTHIGQTGLKKPPLPPRSRSTPVTISAQTVASAMPPLRTAQTQPAPPPRSISQPVSPQKKRHSLTKGLKKAYALSQKNTLTKIATGIALGTVGAAVGADLSGVVEGLDALGFGDGDVGVGVDGTDASAFDTSDTADQALGNPDTSASGNQDFSGLQNGSAETTNWMAQQTWQHVDLPNLAGPTLTPAMLNPTI